MYGNNKGIKMENSKFKGVYVEYHIIQSFPMILDKYDDSSQKTAIVGGTTRARISSSYWKSAVRKEIKKHAEFSMKSIRHENFLRDKILEKYQKEITQEQADECAKSIMQELSNIDEDNSNTGVMLDLSFKDINIMVSYAKYRNFNFSNNDTKHSNNKGYVAFYKNYKNKQRMPIEQALFGKSVSASSYSNLLLEIAKKYNSKMDTGSSYANVEGAVAFSQGISTHKISNDVDLFNALDDLEKSEQVSVPTETSESNSVTYYMYVSLNLGVLAENLGSTDDVATSVELFTRALYSAISSAKQNEISGVCPWDYGRILVRKGQRLQASFNDAVKQDNGYSKKSIEALNKFIDEKANQCGSLYGKIDEVFIGNSFQNSIDDVISKLNTIVRSL